MMKKLMMVALASVMVSSVWGGPKVSILGDSYSTFEGVLSPAWNAVWYYRAPRNQNDVTKIEETWWHQVIARLDGTLEKNNAFSGSTVCNTGYYKKDFSDRSFFARANDLGDPDLILVCGATNDSWCGAPVGEYKYADWTHADLKTFRPAMAKMCSELRTLYPKARLLFILNDGLRPEINESVHAICARYQVQCLDLVQIDKQKGHPSVAGMKAIADQVVVALQKSSNSSK